MSERILARLRDLILPRLEGDTDPWAAEVRALLTPSDFVWPYEVPHHVPAVPREHFIRTAEAFPLGEPTSFPTDRF